MPLERMPRTARGRPHGADDRRLGDALLRAAEQGLEAKSPDELTRQEIAELAGTHSAMIGYYFDSKEGLFRELLAALMLDLCARIYALRAALADDPSDPTRRIVEGLGAGYRANRGACRILAVELTKQRSAIKESYVSRDAAIVVARIADLLSGLVDAGVYAPRADVRKVAVTIRLLVTHALLGPPAWALLAPDDREAGEADWTAYVVDLLDSQLCPAARRDGCSG